MSAVLPICRPSRPTPELAELGKVLGHQCADAANPVLADRAVIFTAFLDHPPERAVACGVMNRPFSEASWRGPIRSTCPCVIVHRGQPRLPVTSPGHVSRAKHVPPGSSVRAVPQPGLQLRAKIVIDRRTRQAQPPGPFREEHACADLAGRLTDRLTDRLT